jgi:hypothetical protein
MSLSDGGLGVESNGVRQHLEHDECQNRAGRFARHWDCPSDKGLECYNQQCFLHLCSPVDLHAPSRGGQVRTCGQLPLGNIQQWVYHAHALPLQVAGLLC